MKKYVMCALLIGGTSTLVTAQEKRLKPSEVPTGVTAAATKRFPTAQISSWSKETEDGKTTFEASIKDAAGKRDAVFLEDGAFVATEEKISISELPPVVKKAIMDRYPTATFRAAERVSHDSGDPDYEVGIVKAAHKEVTVSSGGRILKEE
jgi:hypothetical protein